MDKPKIAGTSPCKVEMEKGKKYAYCTCGLSATQPFCDGQHKGTDFRPDVFEATEEKTVFFCACKQNDGTPYCDGSHKNLPDCSSNE